MRRRRVSRLPVALIGVLASTSVGDGLGAQPVPAADFEAPAGIEFRTANVSSEGVRLHAELFSRESLAGQQLPTVIMAHGWGGTAAVFRRDAIDLANAGYFVITFDYRGWGESDARLVLTEPAPITPRSGVNQQFTAEVMEVREYVDPMEQVTDWFNVISWATTEPMVDRYRIGIRGSSYSGGHVVHVAAHDTRVRAFVSQVGGLDSRWVLSASERERTYEQASHLARGGAYPEPRSVERGSLIGAPIRSSFARYAPVEDARKLTSTAALFIVAENEELLDNEVNARLAFERMPGSAKEYVQISGIGHYDVYGAHRDHVVQLAIQWFDQYLK